MFLIDGSDEKMPLVGEVSRDSHTTKSKLFKVFGWTAEQRSRTPLNIMHSSTPPPLSTMISTVDMK
jgi:hypothetical protein